MTPLERAARALCEENGINPDASDRLYGPNNWQIMRDDVKAILQALRKPSEAMIAKGDLYRENAELMWKAMIDAALEEG